MAWKVAYFVSSSGENPVSEFIDLCTKSQQVKILRLINHLEEYGIQTVIPHIKKLSGTPFWEIRILGKDNIRIIYVVELEKTMFYSMDFSKKGQKPPKRK